MVVLVVVVVPLVLTAGSPLTAAVAVGGLQLIAHAFHHLHALPVTVMRVHGVSEDSGWMNNGKRVAIAAKAVAKAAVEVGEGGSRQVAPWYVVKNVGA